MEAKLTRREAQLLRLLAEGQTYAGASEQLGVSPHTVASHVKNIYRKLGVRSGRAAVWRAIGLGLFAEETVSS